MKHNSLKKIVAIALAAALIFSLAACGKDENTESKKKNVNRTYPSDYQLVWQNVEESKDAAKNDNWEADNIYIEGGKLFIEASVDFRRDVKFKTNEAGALDADGGAGDTADADDAKKASDEESAASGEGEAALGMGKVSLDKDFTNPADVAIEFLGNTQPLAIMNETQHLLISFTLSDLDTEKPEELWYSLALEELDIPLILDLEW